MEWIYKLSEWHFFNKFWGLIAVIPLLLAFHYCMYYTNINYKKSKIISEWVGITFIISLLVGITIYYN